MHSAVEQGVNRGQPNKVHLVWLVNLYSGKEYLAQTQLLLRMGACLHVVHNYTLVGSHT